MRKAGKALGRAVVEGLRAEGTRYVYGQCGLHVMDVYDALAECPDITHVNVKHEHTAAVMADTEGRLTGRPGVCLVTAGPGAVNSLSGVAQAYVAASPLIHISGTVPLGAPKESLHGVDTDDFLVRTYADFTKWSVRLERPEDMPGVLARAYAVATGGRPGPVHIEIPWDVFEAPTPEMPAYRPAARTPHPPADGDLKRLETLLRAAERPVICAGQGILSTGCRDEFRALVDLLRAPVVYTRDARGAAADDNPLVLGQMNEWEPNPYMPNLLARADLVLSVGQRAGTVLEKSLSGMVKGRYVHLGVPDDDAAEGAEVSIGCDLGEALAALGERFRAEPPRGSNSLLGVVAAARREMRAYLDGYLAEYEPARPMHFGSVVKALGRHLAADAVIAKDAGNVIMHVQHFLACRGEQLILNSGVWRAMGFSLGAAMAAKLHYPRRQAVCITGDGAFLMTCGDFVTAVELGLDIVVVVLNDRRFGRISQVQRYRYGREYATRIGAADPASPDYAAFARSMGGRGLRVEEPDHLDDAVDEALTGEGPVILDVVCGFDFPYPDMRRPWREAGRDDAK